MQQTVSILGSEKAVNIYNARVIHANKYTSTTGGWGHWPVVSTLYTDVVFRENTSGDDWPLTIVNIELPLYNDQEVGVICVNSIIVGYIDRQTNQYYYTSGNMARLFRTGLPYAYVWLISIAAGVAIWLFSGNDEGTAWAFLPLPVMMVVYYVQRTVIHYLITRSLDRYLSGD